MVLVVKMTDHKPLRLDIRVTGSNPNPLKETNKESESYNRISIKTNTYLCKTHPSMIKRPIIPGLIHVPEIGVDDSKVINTQQRGKLFFPRCSSSHAEGKGGN
jgi:hypothetical protein